MNLVTRKIRALGAAALWHGQYFTNGEWRYNETGRDREKKYIKLKELGTDPTPEQVAKVANESWVCVTCNECGRSVDAGVLLGEDPDNESCTAMACKDCLIAALALLEGK